VIPVQQKRRHPSVQKFGVKQPAGFVGQLSTTSRGAKYRNFHVFMYVFPLILTIKTVAAFRNVADAAYAMSHAAVEACSWLHSVALAGIRCHISACSSNIYNGRALDDRSSGKAASMYQKPHMEQFAFSHARQQSVTSYFETETENDILVHG